MNTKRIMMRWVIVLFLLATLPVIMAVMAQGEQPLVEAELTSQATLEEFQNEASSTCHVLDACCNHDFYPVNMRIGDVVNGEVQPGENHHGEVRNLWKVRIPTDSYLLVEVVKTGGDGEVDVSLRSRHINTETQGLLFQSVKADIYCIWAFYFEGDDSAPLPYHYTDYQLSVSTPLLVSATTSGTVAGIPFQPGDILAHSDLNNGEERWRMFFDGSDVGITTNVTNIAADSRDRILIGLGANERLDGVDTVTPWDIVIFVPKQYGNDTSGTFQWGLQGKDHNLTTPGERIDALDGFTMGIESDPRIRGCFGFPVSTSGLASVTGPFGLMRQDDEDIFCKVYNPNHGGFQGWDWFFDVDGLRDAPSSEPAAGDIPGLAEKDVYAMSYNDTTEMMYLSIRRGGEVKGRYVSQKEIFAIDYPGYTWGGVVWSGPEHGWNYNIDAFEFSGN